MRNSPESFVEHLFDAPAQRVRFRCDALSRDEYTEAITVGGFPELVLGPQTRRFRGAWCRSYLETVTALANVEQVAEVRRPDLVAGLLQHLAVRSAQEVVVSDLARELQADESTVRSHLEILSALYLIRLVPAWTTSATNRTKRRAVVHILDTALAAHLIGVDGPQLATLGSPWLGPLLESYVVSEIAKQLSWAE